MDTLVAGQKGKVVFDWIESIGNRLPSKKTNVAASTKLIPTMVSRNHFYAVHDMPAIVFELGDNTPRGFLKEKGKVAAEQSSSHSTQHAKGGALGMMLTRFLYVMLL